MKALEGLIYLFICSFFFLSCHEEEENIFTPRTDTLVVSNLNLKGYVQKGPYINGTAITLSELDSQLIATGKNFNTQISDNKGAFGIKDINLKSAYVQLMANGFYFDEVQGVKSASQLTMYALANVLDVSSVNVNLLSHLEKDRVIYLIQEEGKSFTEAKHQAEQEILAVFGIIKEDFASAELLDISQDGEDNAILLAISAILQADNTVAELSELLANIITDIREDGTLDSESNQAKLRAQAMLLNLKDIRTHLVKRYEELGVKASIPNFEKYIDSDGDGILNKDEDDTPDEFTFATQKDVAINTATISNEITIAGLKEGGASDIIISNAKLLINGSVNTDTIAQVRNGDRIKLQLTSSSQYADTAVASLTIGYLTSYFTVVTDDYKADNFSFTAQKDVAVDSFYTSNTITISGLPHPTPATIENGVLIKNGVELQTDTTSMENGDQLAIKLLSSNQYFSTVSSRLDINGIIASFEITTDDYKPDDFSFTPIENAKRDSVYISETITLSGLPYPTPVSIDQGILIINGKEIDEQDVPVKNGDQITVKLTSSSEFESKRVCTVNIGIFKQSFLVTTMLDPIQQMASVPAQNNDFSLFFSLGNKIYAGEYTSKYGNSSSDPISNDLYEYDPLINEWKLKTSFSKNFSHHHLFVIDGKAYLDSDDELWVYNPTDNSLQLKASPSTPKFLEGSLYFSISEKGYVLGYDLNQDISELWEYDPHKDKWTPKRTLPFNRSSYGKGFSIDNKIVIVFPNKYDNPTHSEVWEYNPPNDTWTSKSNAPFYDDSPYDGIGFSIHNEGYLVISKYDVHFGTKKLMYRYNYQSDNWKLLDLDFKENSGYSVLGVSSQNNGYFLSKGDFWKFTPPQE